MCKIRSEPSAYVKPELATQKYRFKADEKQLNLQKRITHLKFPTQIATWFFLPLPIEKVIFFVRH